MTRKIVKRLLTLMVVALWGLLLVLPPVPAEAAATRGDRVATSGRRQAEALLADPSNNATRVPGNDPDGRETDPRLLRKVTIRVKGISLFDFCAQLQEQTGVTLRAARGVADEKTTVFVNEQRTRDVMRAVARLFGYYWERSGEKGAYRYELNQDLKSRLVEEELRNRDLHAALLSLDQAMERFEPYRDRPFEPLQKLEEERLQGLTLEERRRDAELRSLGMMVNGAWGGVQLYFRLTPAERTALAAGEELVFRPDDPNPDRRFPPEWQRSILQSGQLSLRVHDQPIQMADVPGIKVTQIRLWLKRSELGQVSLIARTSSTWPGDNGLGASTFGDTELAIGRNPSAATPDNAKTNVSLRGKPPFDRVITLRPKPSCPVPRNPRRLSPEDNPWDVVADLTEPHVLSGDVWEAVHEATGLPIVADFYSRLYPARKLTPPRSSLFEALCAAGDVLGTRWTKDGDFILCRSTSYFWDRLKEVPNRLLQRWARDRKSSDGLPLADFLEMAALSDQQLSSTTVGEVIQHYWGLWEWQQLQQSADGRRRSRFVATLTPDQLQRAMQPTGLPLQALSPVQQEGAFQFQQAAMKEMERQQGTPATLPAAWWRGTLRVVYIPGGRYMWARRWTIDDPNMNGPAGPVGGRTAAEALAAIRAIYPSASPADVKLTRSGHFSAAVWISGSDTP